MQIQKSNIRNNILEVAKKEFVEKGYRKTSMRNISEQANVTLSNIYNYFKNKDEILEVVLSPVLKELNKMFEGHNYPEKINTDWFEAEDLSEIEDYREHIVFIQKYQEEIDLLFHKCTGSKYENIKEELIDKYTETSKVYLELMKQKYPQMNKDISVFFIHMIAGWWIQILSEMVSHSLTEQEIAEFGKEYMNFATGGWKRLINL